MAVGAGQRELQAMLERSWTRATVTDWTDLLGGCPLFARLSKRRLRRLASLAEFDEFAPGDIVVQAGEPSDAFYVILAGRAKVVGKSRRTLKPGDYFGEMGLIDGEPRSATIAAVDELQAMRLRRRPFLKLLDQEPGIATAMLAELAARVRRLEKPSPV